MKRMKIGGLCLLSLCLMAIFGFGAAGSASAGQILLLPHSHAFPYHLVGGGGISKLRTVGGMEIESQKSHVLVLALSPTLFDTKIEFLEVSEVGGLGSSCENDKKGSAILVNLLGHLGLADPGDKIAVLLLVPGTFEFQCLGGFAKVKVRGGIIGEVTAPALNTSSSELNVSFNQTNGIQEFTTFLQGTETLLNQHEESSLNGGAFEQSGQTGSAHLLALPGQGTFLLIAH